VSARRQIQPKPTEEGIALLISIFILLLISIVAIALIVASGTESSLAGNYRSATGVYYAALAGLEEARGRLLTNSASSFKSTAPAGFLPSPGTALPIGYVRFVVNPGPGDGNVLTTYLDNEYSTEFTAGSSDTKTTASIWTSPPLNTALNFPGPLYKWVRINAVSEQWLRQGLGQDVAPFDGKIDSTPLFYDGTKLTDVPSSGSQVLEITSLAVLPNGSQKLLQYLIAPGPIALPPFLAALTLSGSPGNGVTFHAPASNSTYAVKGDDQDCSGNLTGQKYPAIGLLTNSNSDIVQVKNGIPTAYQPYYTGVNNPGPYVPDVEDISSSFLPLSLQSPSNLDALAQSIIQNADAVVITPTPSGTPPYLGTATGADLTPLGMSSTNPLTVVVNGNLDISNWSTDGYGLLLVTGTFTYDPDTTWNGIILVIGQGKVNGSNAQYKQINGAMLVAKTRDLNNQVLTGLNLGGASVQFTDSMQGNGIRYSACWIQKARPKGKYKILSFREISQ
jgi:Tfp pilus assembly protein PilX